MLVNLQCRLNKFFNDLIEYVRSFGFLCDNSYFWFLTFVSDFFTDKKNLPELHMNPEFEYP